MVSPVQGYWQLVLEFLASLIERETDWLAPAIFVLLIVAALGFFLEGSVVAPASYSILAQQCSYPTRAAGAPWGGVSDRERSMSEAIYLCPHKRFQAFSDVSVPFWRIMTSHRIRL